MPKELPDIVIDNFQKGIADSDYLGFADMRNLDIFTVPGTARINWSTVKESSTTVGGRPYWFAYDEVNLIMYMEDDQGKIYKSSTGNFTSWSLLNGNTTGDANNGLVIWHDYLFSFRAAAVDVYGPLSGSPSWTTSWSGMSFSSTGLKPTLVGQDDILYIGSGNKVMSLQETSGSTFAPGTSSTYTFTSAALTLPKHYYISCFTELGVNLMIGTYKGVVSYTGVPKAAIFPWDRTSSSFNLPILVNELGINAMITLNNIVYFNAGTRGALYATTGSSTKLLRELYKAMQHSSLQQATFGLVNINATADNYAQCLVAHKGRIFFSVTLSSAYTGPAGVWSLDVNTGVLNFEYQISTGSTVTAGNIYVPCITSVNNDNLLIGWDDSGNANGHGIDMVVTSARFTNYAAYVDSPMIPVGTPLGKRSLSQIEFTLAEPLTTGQGVKLAYRTTTDASFTTIGTYDYATYSGIRSLNVPLPVGDVETIQIRASLTTGSSSTTSPTLRAIRLR